MGMTKGGGGLRRTTPKILVSNVVVFLKRGGAGVYRVFFPFSDQRNLFLGAGDMNISKIHDKAFFFLKKT